MDSRESLSRSARLLDRATREKRRLRRHLLVAAAIGEAFPHDAIVVGGTAEEYWTSDAYHETDLDICTPVSGADEASLRLLGFVREGRHWYHGAARVAVEFPDSQIDGDPERVVRVTVPGGSAAKVIGVDDLYLDRLRQATMNEGVEDLHFHSALAVAASCFELMDWRYVRSRVRVIEASEPSIGAAMRRISTRLRRRVLIASRPRRV